MFFCTKALAVFSLTSLLAHAQQPSFEELAKLFENEPASSSSADQVLLPGRTGVRMFDLSFTSPVNGRVPGVLVTPDRPGRFPVVLFGHWMMQSSPLRNRNEFLEEAVVLARAGAICLLLDTPLVRAGVAEDPNPMHGPEALAGVQMAREWRRALDILLWRPDIDSNRVAYVGHSFSAGVGARLTGVEKRIQSFVLMADTYSLRDFVFDNQNAALLAWRKDVGDDNVRADLQRLPFQDSLPFVKRSVPAAIFLQNGRADKEIPERAVRSSFAHFQEPKRIRFYDSGHELNAGARTDRVKWLAARLGLRRVDYRALSAIPQLR